MLTIVRVELLTNFVVLTQRNESSLLTTYCTLSFKKKEILLFDTLGHILYWSYYLFVIFAFINMMLINFLDIVRHRTTVQVYVVAFIFCIELINIFFFIVYEIYLPNKLHLLNKSFAFSHQETIFVKKSQRLTFLQIFISLGHMKLLKMRIFSQKILMKLSIQMFSKHYHHSK